jgi:DNA-binding CsgD family transcriptional regulator
MVNAIQENLNRSRLYKMDAKLREQLMELGSIAGGSFFKQLLNLIPISLFIVDNDLRVLFSNVAGLNLIPWTPGLTIRNRCGDLMKCRYAIGNEIGCGGSEQCKTCAIRCSVRDTYENHKINRAKAYVQVMHQDQRTEMFLMATTAPIVSGDQLLVLLSLEDVSDLVEKQRSQQVLREKAQDIEKAEKTLNLLLEQQAEEKQRLQENLMLNIINLLIPLIEKLKKTKMSELQQTYISLIESKINEITSPFYRTMSGEFFGLTPMEIQVADLIKAGRGTKDIAQLIGTSTRAIEFHRNNIRKKVGITNKKERLHSFLTKMV